MKSAGKPHRSSRGKVISIAIIAIAVAVAIYVEHWISIHPSTDDATIDADVVHVASAVGGRIIELPVTENAKISKGDLLFRIDPLPYRLAVEQAEADLGVAAGALDTRRRAIATEKSNATIAAAQIKRAQTNLELATRTAERLRPLAGKAYVPTQQFDQAQTAQRDAATSLRCGCLRLRPSPSPRRFLRCWRSSPGLWRFTRGWSPTTGHFRRSISLAGFLL